MRRQLVEQTLVEQLLAGERALLRRERLVLEGLQFRRDVALGVLQRLAAPVVVRHLVGLRARDLDVEAVDAVVLDLEIGYAGTLALARLHLRQEIAAVRLDRAQLVQLGVVAVRDHAAFPYHRRGLRLDGGLEHAEGRGARRKGERQLRQPRARATGKRSGEIRQPLQRLAQAREIARPRRLQCDAGRDALDVRAFPERVTCSAPRSRLLAVPIRLATASWRAASTARSRSG